MDLSELRTVLTTPATTSTVLLEASRDAEDAEHEIRLRWQAVADRLREQGAPDDDVAALGSAAVAPTGRSGQASRLLVARGGRVVLDEVLPTGVPDGIGTASVGPFPEVGVLLASRREGRPFLVVRADRTGADVETYLHGDAIDVPPDDAATVKGTTHHIRKVHPGGWADLRFDHNVEENWKENGRKVAERAVEQARRHGVRLVVLAGDVHARNAVREALPEIYDVVEVEGDVRAAGASQEGLEDAVRMAVAQTLAAETDTLVERLRTARAEDGAGALAPDLARTVAALQQGQVSVLVLDPPALRGRTLLAGPGPHDVALPGGPKTWEGEGVPCPADVALVRAAVLTDADVELLPAGQDLPDGAAALLRWDAPQPAGERLP